MGAKSEIVGVVVSDRMQKSVVVAVDWREPHPTYGKLRRRTSTFMAHDEHDAAKLGDRVAIVEGRPQSRRKRWVVTRIVERAKVV